MNSLDVHNSCYGHHRNCCALYGEQYFPLMSHHGRTPQLLNARCYLIPMEFLEFQGLLVLKCKLNPNLLYCFRHFPFGVLVGLAFALAYAAMTIGARKKSLLLSVICCGVGSYFYSCRHNRLLSHLTFPHCLLKKKSELILRRP